MSRIRPTLLRAVAALLAAGCTPAEPGASVYFRTTALPERRVRALEEALTGERFALVSVTTSGAEGGPWRGRVVLARGEDGAAERARLVAWLRARPEVAAASADSAAIPP